MTGASEDSRDASSTAPEGVLEPGARFCVGNQTAFSARNEMDPFHFALAHGFEAFEWFSDRKGDHGIAWQQLSPELRRRIREQATKCSLLQAVHAPWQASVLREDGRTALRESIDFARDIGASTVVVHLEAHYSASYASALTEVARYALESGVRLALENTVETGPEDVNRVFRGLREVRRPPENVGLCWDLGHANLCAATRNDYVRFLDLVDPSIEILHVHVHENWGDADTHLLMFTGPSGRDSSGLRAALQLLAQRGFRGILTLEVWPDPPERLLGARNRLAELVREVLAGLEGGQAPAVPRSIVSGGGGGHGSKSGQGEMGGQSSELAAFVQALLLAHQERRSWRRRLQWVRDVLSDPEVRGQSDKVATLATYLHLLATGAISCEEDGGHYRPSHHAALGLEIEQLLLGAQPRPALWLVRRMLRWLPSHDAPFRRAEPLTRIRDIAHRNDIPKELKQEIKTTLQNKLHRSAGPEDLLTSARLLERLRSQSRELPAAFLAAFSTFHLELEEFFNASSLDRELERTAPLLPEVARGLAERLRARVERGSRALEDQRDELLTNLQLRRHLAPAFSEVGDSLCQRKRILDVKLEERAFVVLSQCANQLRAAPTPSWPSLLGPLGLALDHLALSGTLEEHNHAVREALEQWVAEPPEGFHEQHLRLVALLTLAKVVVTRAMDGTLAVLAQPSQRLGAALGLPAHQIAALTEGEVRQGLVFQVSRLVQLLSARARRVVGTPPWQPIVAGTAEGTFVNVGNLGQLPTQPGAFIAFVRHVEGDEALHPSLRGVLVLGEIALLSHLCIRARQAHVVMAAGGEGSEVPAALLGRRGWLVVDAAGVRFGEGALLQSGDRGRVYRPAVSSGAAPAEDARSPQVVALNSADLVRVGPKAYTSRRILELSRTPTAGFTAPDGVVIPFGVMEMILDSYPRAGRQYGELVDVLSDAEDDALVETSRRLRELVSSIAPPDWLAELLEESIDLDRLYVVRSSSNFEDLAGYSAAGLHDSVIGVPGGQVAGAAMKVWASLHSPRAAVAWRQAGVVASDARMAVLVQPLVLAEASFVMFTRSPLRGGTQRAYAELAVGLGDVLTSGSGEGRPLCLEFDKSTGNHEVVAFPSYPDALRATPTEGLKWQAVRYARVPLVTSRDARHRIVSKLANAAQILEDALGGPQDVEGALVNDTLAVVQSRPAIAQA